MDEEKPLPFGKEKQVGRYGRKTKKQKTQRTIQSLIKSMDRVFSTFICLRDADEYGMVKCITCTKRYRWNTEKIHAGHFMSRNHLSTRYHEKNVNGQCNYCNAYCSGEQFLHGQAIDLKYGRGTAKVLTDLSRTESKTTPQWYEYHIKLFRYKLKELQNQRGG